MALYNQGITGPLDSINAGVVPPDVFGVAINWFVNRTPLLARLPRLPVGSDSFLLTNDNFRPRSAVTTAAYTTGSSTVLTFADSSSFDVGDVLQVESEFFLVTAIASSTTVTVTGGYAGSTGANHASGSTAYLITNTRTGAEVDITAMSRIPVTVEQYNETVQHAYAVGGSHQANTNFVSGLGTPIQRDKLMCAQHCFDDFETGCLYGAGAKRSGSVTRPMMKGLRTLMATNRVTTPSNGSAYTPSDFVRDVIQPCYDAGGQPSLVIVSTNFLTGLSVWGQKQQRLNAGTTVFGTPIELFEVSFLPGLMFIPHPLLRKGTAIALSAPEVRIRMKRALIDKPRGSRGDAEEGDMIMEGSIELDNEAHHSWTEGITGWASVA